MNKKSNSISLIRILVIFYIVWKIPVFALYINTYMAAMLLGFLVVLLVTKARETVLHADMLLVATLVYIVFLLIDSYITGGALVINLWSAFLEAFPLFLGFILVKNKMDKTITAASKVIILAHLVTAITTYIGLQTYPEASRLLATSDVDYTEYYQMNIGGYGFVYTLVLIHPMITCLLRRKGKLVFALLYTAISMGCVFASAYALATMMFMCSCVAYVLPVSSGKRIRRNQIVIIVFVLATFVLVLPMLLRAMAQWDVLKQSADKMNDVANMLQGVGSSADNTAIRIKLYAKSFESFLQYPVFGGKLFNAPNGGHSFILDTLANWGLIGFFILLFLYWQIGKIFVQLTKGSYTMNFAILTLIMGFVLSLLNTGSWLFVLGFVVPVSAYRIRMLDNETNKS